MKKCINCGELIGDNVNECFKCHYNYSYKRVITPQEIRNRRERNESEKENESQRMEALEKVKELQIKKNPWYEYRIELIDDLETGQVDATRIQYMLTQYSSNGWRLHSVFVNEWGKTSTSALGVSVNATIDQTVLIFERCIKAQDVNVEG